MKAQLVSQDVAGRHNAELEKSSSRILRGGSWKKQRIIVLLPAANTISTRVALSYWNLIFPPNQAVHRMVCLGMEVGEAYSTAIEEILNSGISDWEFILTLEHDNMPPADGVLMLCEDMEEHPELSAISGLYWTKGESGVPQIWGDPKDPVVNYRPQVPQLNSLQECCGIGMGFAIWRLKMFRDKKLRRPWFKTLAGKEGVGTQDLYFWNDARKHGMRCAVDCRVRVGHYDAASDTVW